MLRNRVVHAGYQPAPLEAEEARSAWEQMRQFARDRVWERRRRFRGRRWQSLVRRDGPQKKQRPNV
jgi:hypothetical protein